MMQITVKVSDELGQQLQQFQDRLQEIVKRVNLYF
jgi:predicted transcriptional regulator